MRVNKYIKILKRRAVLFSIFNIIVLPVIIFQYKFKKKQIIKQLSP